MEQSITQYVDTLFNNMENFSQKDGLIGKPVTQGDKTFLPVMSITLGYGGGDTQSKNKTNVNNTTNVGGGMLSGALGIGAKLCTDAIIVIDKENVMMAPVGAPGNMSQVINKIPQIISSMSPGAGGQSGQSGSAQGGSQGMSGGTQGSQTGGGSPGSQTSGPNKSMF
jgi:uncharacterized spore protein YtfJ